MTRRSPSRRAAPSRRPTSSSSSSTRRTASRPGTRRWPTSSAAPRKPVLVLANKIDDPRARRRGARVPPLGLGDPIPVSALHGHGTGDLLDRDRRRARPARGRAEVGEDAIRVAILGRPNVGKSSLLNAIVGEERVIVSEKPGTTRDAIDTIVRARRHDLRPRGHGRHAAQAPAAAGDRVLLGAAHDPGGRARRRRARPRGLERGARRPGSRRRRRGAHGRVLDARRPLEVGHRDGRGSRTSARGSRSGCASARRWWRSRRRAGRGVGKLLDRVEELFAKHTARVPTAGLNRFLQELRSPAAGPDSENGRRLNLLYGTQVDVDRRASGSS